MENRQNSDMNPAMHKSEEEEEREEVEMEMFFALLRSFSEARNRRRTELGELQRDGVKVDDDSGSSSRKKRKKTQEVTQTSWIPSFEWEDFTKEIEYRGTPPAFPTPAVLDQMAKPKVEDGLDLNLAL